MTKRKIDYWKRKDEHRCVTCGVQMDMYWDKARCPKCGEKDKTAQALDRNFYREKGICYQCRINPVTKGYKSCADCRDKNRYRMQEAGNKERNNNAMKERYAMLKLQGLCIACGKETALNWSVYCPKCYERKKKCTKKVTQR